MYTEASSSRYIISHPRKKTHFIRYVCSSETNTPTTAFSISPFFCLLGKKATSWEVTCNYAYLHFWSFYLLQAFADQCDAVSRRMGFMPLPLGVVMIRVVSTAFKTNSRGAPVVFLLAYLALLTFRYVLTSQ